MNKYLFYFTGTGNSFQVSQWISEHFQCQTVAIENARKDDFIDCDEIIIVGPAHGFTLIWSIFKFLLWMPWGKGRSATSITCRASWKIGPWFLPGLSGSANYIVSILLMLKGYRVKGILALDMPSNWLVMHWGLHPDNVEVSFQKAKAKLNSFLSNKRRAFLTFDNLYELIFGALLLRISFMYFCFARLIFAKIFFAGKDCTCCGVCESQCPVEAIKMIKGVPFWRYNCESCMRCVAGCPTAAINACHSWFALIIFAGTIPIATYLNINHFELSMLTQLAFNILMAWTLYYILYLLSRLPLLDKFFTYTSFSHYFRRYAVKEYFKDPK